MAEPPAAWRNLRRFTQARIALGRAGNAVPTAAHLAFQAAHAGARDAVHAALDVADLLAGLRVAGLPGVAVTSAAADRGTYLLRPDLGRALRPQDTAALAAAPCPGGFALVVCDGLSALAAQRHAVPLLARLGPALRGDGLALAPVVVAVQGRVALGDAIGAALQAEAVLVLIGERPGLSAADSLGAYLTWHPRAGVSDAERNCVSNIRPGGVDPAAAAAKLLWLIRRMRALRLTGVALKDEQPQAPVAIG